jgi:hypothetical protein
MGLKKRGVSGALRFSLHNFLKQLLATPSAVMYNKLRWMVRESKGVGV